jgi:hypothetical protein
MFANPSLLLPVQHAGNRRRQPFSSLRCLGSVHYAPNKYPISLLSIHQWRMPRAGSVTVKKTQTKDGKSKTSTPLIVHRTTTTTFAKRFQPGFRRLAP